MDLDKILEKHEKWIKLYNNNKNICNCLQCKINGYPPGDESKFIPNQNMCKLHNFLKKQIKHIINDDILRENDMQWVFDHTDMPMTFGNLFYFIDSQYEKDNFHLCNQYKEFVDNLPYI